MAASSLSAAETIVAVGRGSYTLAPPPGSKQPPATPYRTNDLRGPTPTNDWWTSLVWTPRSEPQYAHPLVLRVVESGMQVYYPGPAINANKVGIFAEMPRGGADFILGHSAQPRFAEARLHGFSDWFVTAALAEGDRQMLVSYGHGSPFVYALYTGGQPQLTFAKQPEVWRGTAGDNVLGITVDRRHYGLFGPKGATWSGLGGNVLTCRSGGKPYFSVAVLPDNRPATLDLFRRHAYAHVVDTKVEWRYVPADSVAAERFTYRTKVYEGDESDTLFALYPHQWQRTITPLLDYQYDSVRGPMKLGRGTQFVLKRTFPGVLPALPEVDQRDQAALRQLVEAEAAANAPRQGDTYWIGKRLGKVATLVSIAEQVGATAAKEKLLAELRGRLEGWLTARPDAGGRDPDGLFYYDRTWGTLIGYPASYGSDTDLNDHHFHYGYFIRAAAELARHDRQWAADGQFGGMIKLLIRDIASPDPADPLFPRLRNFDPYAGHSWASGSAKFASGNNQESSSEAMNAWAGLILWGEVTSDAATRDLGIYLYSSEMDAIDDYWFDVTGTLFPKGYPHAAAAMIWGGKTVNETWFSGKPICLHGINWLPLHAGSLYLGRYPDYCRRNYEALVAANGGEHFDQWADLALMYRALFDPAGAVKQFDGQRGKLAIEDGNSRANLYQWLHTLESLGPVDRRVTADAPLYAVFSKSGRRTHVAYNLGAAPRTVTFSDGATVRCPAGGFGVQGGAAK